MLTLDVLPDVEGSRSEDVTTRDIIVVEHLSLDEDLHVVSLYVDLKALADLHQYTILKSLLPSCIG